ncbi:3154_t:CDS:10 [Funneliformis caledonium]|uniref:3154_t:CDS:1 n=1 Tax=Funneliformis caledonium TaxID=1117310 RepID=A0A9N8ZC42_9GLOM|nr:3154_t:CDS:10 [Funneliformis caledonium]
MFKKKLSKPVKKPVEVNQRHLIDKILARYSTEFVIYRELMQNSSNLQLIVRPLDWKRITNIAVGNPGEQKIGAFGVGFYSLFSICENPSVMSGGKMMSFDWEGDKLNYIQSDDKSEGNEGWTIFEMVLRKPDKFPIFEEFTRFLAGSLAFMSALQEVSVYFNDTRVINLSKELSDMSEIEIAPEINTYSPNKMFQLTKLEYKNIYMKVTSPKENSEQQSLITDFQETSMLLKVANGNLKITVADEFSKEMFRIIKKDLPNDTIIDMMFTEFQNYDKLIPSIFKDLLPYPEQGKIYIGFSTHQTTGCCLNLSAYLVPSVERESIDLVNKTLKEYNEGILYLAGVLCRILYENEMSEIKKLYEMIGKDNVECERLENHAAHVLRYFTFNKSTPKISVSDIIENQFFDCSKQRLPILSTCGILPITDVRMPNSKMEGFIKTIPIVSKFVFEQCKPFFEKAKNIKKIIKDLSFQDVLLELKNRPLFEIEMTALLKWLISYKSKETNNITPEEFAKFMELASFLIEDKIRRLNTIRYVIDSSLLLPDTEVPDYVLPYNISKDLNDSEINECFGWVNLPLVYWARFIVDHPDLESEPNFAENVHIILASRLKKMSQDDKKIVKDLLICKRCIPTTEGMKKPDEAYLETVDLFPDIPTIKFKNDFNFQELMNLLDVNKVIKIKYIDYYISNEEYYDPLQIAKYFGSSLSNLEESYLEELKAKEIWFANGTGNLPNNKAQRFVASDLYIPLDLYREFGLPIINWTGNWDHNSDEAKFLIKLGLMEYPTLSKILVLCTPSSEREIRYKALEYFIKNFENKYFDEYQADEINISFLPCSEQDRYAKPSECYINPDCAVMGFNVIHQKYRFRAEKLGLKHHPDQNKLIEMLTKYLPQSEGKAKEMFEYLETRKDGFVKLEWDFLNGYEFIPTRNKDHPDIIIHKSPPECFFKSQGKIEDMDEMFDQFLSFIDFGEKANKFLQKCGVERTPSAVTIANLLVNSSLEIWRSVDNNIEKYKNILKKLSDDFNTIEKDKDLFKEMREKPVLLGVLEGDKGKQYELNTVENIYINDDTTYMETYCDLLLTIPKDFPKSFYKYLGCKSLNDSIEEEVEISDLTRETKESKELQEKLNERAHLFYIDHPKYVIKKDEECLRNIKVVETNRIEIKLLLKAKNLKKSKSISAYIHENKEMKIFTLYLTSKQDYHDIARSLVKFIYKSHKSIDINYLYMILNALNVKDLKCLENVSPKQDVISEEEQENYLKENDSKQENPKSEDLFKSLKAMFADCEDYYIHQCLEQADDDKLINAENQLMEGNYPKIKIPVDTYPYDPPVTVKTGKTFMNVIQITRYNLGSYLSSKQIVYCKTIEEGHSDRSLQFEKFLDGIEFYIPKDMKDKSAITSNQSLKPFANLLKDLIEVFECPPKFIHAFYDNSNLITYNEGSALFFNFKIYIDLYKADPKFDAKTYWYMVICHALAHKFVEGHNSEYQYHFSSLVTKYMKSLVKKMI